jgi:hypothetical protein
LINLNDVIVINLFGLVDKVLDLFFLDFFEAFILQGSQDLDSSQSFGLFNLLHDLISSLVLIISKFLSVVISLLSFLLGGLLLLELLSLHLLLLNNSPLSLLHLLDPGSGLRFLFIKLGLDFKEDLLSLLFGLSGGLIDIDEDISKIVTKLEQTFSNSSFLIED